VPRAGTTFLASEFVDLLFSFYGALELVLRRAWVTTLKVDMEAIAWGLLAESSPAHNR
jgi:hypothetical protein